MAGESTTFIAAILKSIIGENDWGTEIRDNFENIAKYFAQTGTLTLDELNDAGTGIEGEYYGQPYYNTDDDFLAVCADPGTPDDTERWVYASSWLMDFAADNLSFNWKKGQITEWVMNLAVGTETYTPWITPDPSGSEPDSGNYHFIQAVGAVSIGPPQGVTGTSASVLIIAFCQGGGGSIASWDSVYCMAGGVELPVTEVEGEVDLFSCVRAPNGKWMVSPAFKFDVGYGT